MWGLSAMTRLIRVLAVVGLILLSLWPGVVSAQSDALEARAEAIRAKHGEANP